MATQAQYDQAQAILALRQVFLDKIFAGHGSAHTAFDNLHAEVMSSPWQSYADTWHDDFLGPPERFEQSDYVYAFNKLEPIKAFLELLTVDVVIDPDQSAPTVTLGQRPPEIDGCMSTWSEQQVSNVVRSAMEGQVVKVRRRTTGIMRNAQVTLNLDSKLLPKVMDWFNIECQGGVLPTRITEPDRTDAIWRFKAPPQITWNTNKVVQLTFEIEQMPFWRGL